MDVEFRFPDRFVASARCPGPPSGSMPCRVSRWCTWCCGP